MTLKKEFNKKFGSKAAWWPSAKDYLAAPSVKWFKFEKKKKCFCQDFQVLLARATGWFKEQEKKSVL